MDKEIVLRTSGISVHVQEDASVSLLLQNSATANANPNTDPATDEMLQDTMTLFLDWRR